MDCCHNVRVAPNDYNLGLIEVIAYVSLAFDGI